MKLRALCLIVAGFLVIGSSESSGKGTKPEDNTPAIKAALSMVMPASGVRENGEYVGFEVDLINALLEGYTPETKINFIDAPNWVRTLQGIRYGRLDLLTLVSFREERKDFMDYIAPMGIEAAYLVTRVDQDVGTLETLDDLAIEENFILVDSKITWNQKFDERIESDQKFASNFILIGSARASSIADLKRIKEDESYRKQLESSFPNVYEDGNVSLGFIAERISMGTIGGYIIVHYQVAPTIEGQKKRIEDGGMGVPLKAIRIKAFEQETTYLAASKKTPLDIRSYMKSKYKELRSNGTYEKLWKKWYGDIEQPRDVEQDDR